MMKESSTPSEQITVSREEWEGMKARVQELEKKLKETEEEAMTDHLTQTYTRRYFETEVHKRLSELPREQAGEKREKKSHMSVLVCDINQFKKINDDYGGHERGDQILKDVAKLLRKNVRESDTVCRWGGDEFVILMPGANEQQAKEKAEEIAKIIERYLATNRPDLYEAKVGTLSIGAAEMDAVLSLEENLKHADQAMYVAKKEHSGVKTFNEIEEKA